MRKLFYFLSLGMLVTACHKDLSEGGGKENPDFNVPQNFNWATLERKTIEVKEVSSVYLVKSDGQKALLGENLSAGKYDFTVGKGRRLEVGLDVAPANKLSRAGEEKMIYFPSAGNWAMMMVEDVYPYLGDLDLNDAIFKFRLEYKMYDERNVSALTIFLDPVALGGKQYKQVGVALQFLGLKNFVSQAKISGQEVDSDDMFTLNINGTENGNEKTVPLIGNLYDRFSQHEGFVNTYTKFPNLPSEDVRVEIIFDSENMPEYSQIQLLKPDVGGANMIDLFVTFGDRSKEVHVKGAPQTSKIGDEYKKYESYSSSPENWVWALILENVIKYPEEGYAIYKVYPLFKDWVNGAGDVVNEEDWTYDHVSDILYGTAPKK